MQRILFLSVTVLLLSSFVCNINAQRKRDQSGKEEKSFDWNEIRPKKLSNVKDIDTYIMQCDTIWNRITTYRDSVTFFKIDTLEKNIDGTPYYVVKIRDDNGVERGFWSSMLQCLQWTASGLSITADAAIINLSATSATLEMATRPLIAISYGACIKAAPVVTGIAFNEIKYITENARKQAKDIRQLRDKKAEKSTDRTILIPITDKDVDLTAMEIGSMDEFGSDDEAAQDSNLPKELEGLLDIL